MGKGRKLIIRAIFVLILATYTILLFRSNGYYTYKDMLGPLSKDPYVIPVLVLLIIYSWLMYSTKGRTSTSLQLLLLIILIVPIIVKYFLPDLADVYYIENFYDASSHMLRGSFVTLTGHSSPAVDHYFGFQPGFFWVTATFVDIVAGPQSSFTSPVFSFLIKWFPILAIVLYIPILYYFARCFGITSSQAVGVLFLIFCISLDHYHYAAQTWGNALYWIMLALTYRYIKSKDSRYIYLLLLVLSSMIFVHQGVYIFAIVASTSVFLVLFLRSRFTKDSLRKMRNTFFAILLFQIVIWQVNAFIFTNSYKDFLNAFKHVKKEFSAPSTPIRPSPSAPSTPRTPKQLALPRFLQIIIDRIERAYKPWENIVIIKAMYFTALILVPLFTFLSEYIGLWKSKQPRNEDIALISFSIVLLTAIILGYVAIGLGGAGYIERIPLLLQPFTGVAMVRISSQARSFKSLMKVFTIFLILLIISAGSLLYFSGRNFQSTTYSSKWSVRAFLSSIERPKASLSELYKLMRVSWCISSSSHTKYPALCAVYPHAYIQVLYYRTGNPQLLERTVGNLITDRQLIYSNGISLLLGKN